jgi:dihydropteroate synthase
MNSPTATLTCGRFSLSLSKPLVMGIVNVTPDSFQEIGRHLSADAAIAHAHQLLLEGADILDIGAESTRPGAVPLTISEELDRLMPVVQPLLELKVPLSIDTRRPEVMREMVALGVDMINDVGGFVSHQSLLAVTSEKSPHAVALCAMHMQGQPLTMQLAPTYRSVIAEVRDFFYLRHKELLSFGIRSDRIAFDPGIGFGKTVEHNIELIRHLKDLQAGLSEPVAWLVGLSRKSLIGALTGRPASDRLVGSAVGAIAAIESGAQIVRVHDVAATVDAIKVWQALT